MECSRCAKMLDDPDRALADVASLVDATDVNDCCRETVELLRMEHSMKRLMPVFEPHPALDSVILKSAAARVAGATAMLAVAPAAPVSSLETSPAKSFVARLRSWVTAPQVAMATITALAVVIGVFYVPSQRTPMEARGDTVMSVPSASTGAPASQAEPMPVELAPPPSVIAMQKPDEDDDHAADPREVTAADVDGTSGAAEAQAMVAAMTEGRAEEATASRELVALAEAEAPADSMDRAMAPSPTMAPAPMAARTASRSAAMAPPATTATGTTASESAAAAPPVPAAADALVRARVLRSRGQCAAAIPLYEQWLDSSEAGSRGDAMLELANCYTLTGRVDRARRIYERATSVPQVASRARVELESLDSAPPAASSRSRAEARAGAGATSSPPAAVMDNAY